MKKGKKEKQMKHAKAKAITIAIFFAVALTILVPAINAVNKIFTPGGGNITVSKAGAITVTPKSGQNFTVAPAGGGAIALGGPVSIGSGGATITKVLTGSGSVDFTALAAGACENFTITVTGAANGNPVSLGIPAAAWTTTEYATIQGFVSAADTVTLKRCNLTNATTALSNPAAVTVTAYVWQP